MSENIRDLVIIGGGPAGLSAGIYAKRALLDVVIIEKNIYGGGQIAVTDRVDNYLGLYGINGFELAMKFKEHAAALEIPILEGEVDSIKDGEVKEIYLSGGDTIYSKAVFISTGADHKLIGCKGEKEFAGRGVSYCATCDGAFFRNRTAAVVGGGNIALQDALYLANICEKVYLIHRREGLRGEKILQKKVLENEKIEFLPNYVVDEILGEDVVNAVNIRDKNTGDIKTLEISGIFIAIGMKPNTNLVKDLVKLDETGYIISGEDTRTSVRGIYAIGDVRTKALRQLITAASDGANAVKSLEEDLNSFSN